MQNHHIQLWLCMQVKVAEHVTTGHKVAIKILNKKKIKHMDMEEKGMLHVQFGSHYALMYTSCCVALY